MLEWLGETVLPSFAVLCTPSKSSEAWVVSICCPDDIDSDNNRRNRDFPGDKLTTAHVEIN